MTPITAEDMATLTRFDARKGYSDLTGLQLAIQSEILKLRGDNPISDLSPLAGLIDW